MILEEETFKKFGYYSKELSYGSNKKIIAKCDNCGKIRESSKHNYHNLCISCAQKGKHFSEEHKQKIREFQKGRHHTEETKQKMREAKHNISKETKQKMKEGHLGERNPNFGKHFSEEYKQKISDGISGENHPNWKGGTSKTFLYSKNGFTLKLKEMIRERDKYICQYCGKSPALDVHHIIPFRINKDNSLLNLITLCRSCHIHIEYLTDRILKENKNPMKIFYQKWSTEKYIV